ncbi:TPA: elongation factor P [Candidatus Dependentiae bacterium]|nr:MAG: Elongation factor P [candidate division TM6 bacterium GW2011_GWF2_43_87]HBL98172.1 elongation factor P [Candidatus Dependentiae bacterium]
MLEATYCKRGARILYRDEPHMVVEYTHMKPGKGAAFVRLKLRNMVSQSMFEQTFRPEEKFDEPKLEYNTMQYLYKDDDKYVFMNTESFEQLEMEEALLEDVKDYLKEQAEYVMLHWNGKLLGITPPMHMELKVEDTPPGVKGDTAQGSGTKPATLETGLVVQVPLFVNIDDIIKVDTRDGKYIERVLK